MGAGGLADRLDSRSTAGAEQGVYELSEIIQYLKEHGERLESEIAKGTGLSLEKVRVRLSDLSARGEVIMCQVTRFADGKSSAGVLCRVAGYIPPAAPGRKPKAR
jgi:hypothetical protein